MEKFYLIFGMCDEIFSINYTVEVPEDIDKGWFMFFVTLFNHFYWFSGATIGGIVGSLLKFDASGISFVMTAMFVVIFLEQWLRFFCRLQCFMKIKKHLLLLLGFSLFHIV